LTGPEILVGLSSPLTAVVGGALFLLIKTRGKEAAKEQFGESVRSELAVFKSELIKELNGTYRRSELCKANMEPIRKDLDELHEYSHNAKHELANRLMGLEMKVASAKTER
jgi:hypothetical protein